MQMCQATIEGICSKDEVSNGGCYYWLIWILTCDKRAWRLPTGKIHFRHGDFLDVGTSDLYATLKRADVLLVNNYAFDWQTNHSLAQLFLDLKEGTKIISLKSFVPKSHKINQRTFHMPESILRVEEFEYFSEAVSWTNNGGTYYVATIDRSRLKPFYDGMYRRSQR